MAGQQSYSISEVISTDGAIRITLESKKMPGWFAELDMNALDVAKLIEKRYRIQKKLIESGIDDRSGFLTDQKNKLGGKNACTKKSKPN